MLRHSLVAFVLGLAALLALAAPSWAATAGDPGAASSVGRADPAGVTTTTVSDLPGTTLEAQERDDGNTSPAPWLIGSALAAAVSIGVGGTILKRHQS